MNSNDPEVTMASNEKRRDVQFEEIEYFGEPSESSNSDLTELTYLLDWTLRDAIIANLNGYTQLLLIGKRSATEDKLLQANCDLYQRLINLPLKLDEESSDQSPSKVVLELAFGVKGEILAALSTNQSLSKSGLLASKETRLKVVKRNNWLVSRLMNLSVSVSHGATDDQTSFDANGKRRFLSGSIENPQNLKSRPFEFLTHLFFFFKQTNRPSVWDLRNLLKI